MPATDLHLQESETDRVVRWRTERLVRAGYDAEVARELATRADVDLHFAVELIERGCAPEMAARILR
jgi:hypothetical protein